MNPVSNIDQIEQLKSRFKNRVSLEGFSDNEILRMILSYIIPKEQIPQTAEKLSGKFRSIKEILDADISQLVKIYGIDENTACFLKFFGCVYDVCEKNGEVQKNSVDVRNFPRMYGLIYNLFENEEKSVLKILPVNENLQIQCIENGGDFKISKGTDTGCYGKETAKAVLRSGCSMVIIAHNRPHGVRKPLEKDIIFTRKIMVFLRALDITLLDHYISGKDGAVSMRQQGLIYDLDEC